MQAEKKDQESAPTRGGGKWHWKTGEEALKKKNVVIGKGLGQERHRVSSFLLREEGERGIVV